jgi:hypothetical protein
MVTIAMGATRWRLCRICTGRADKTTVVKAVVCAHPYSRAHHDSTGPTTYRCIDCFEPVAAPPETAPEKRCTCGVCADAGHAGLSLTISVGIFGGALLALAGVSGKLRYLWDHLPLTETPNGFTMLCLMVLTIGCLNRIYRHRALPDNPYADEYDPESSPEVDEWWFGTSPFDDVHPDGRSQP